MNVVFHFLFNYLVINALFGNAWGYIAVILVSSVFIDFTHLPYLLKVREGVVKKRFGSECRTRFHEIYGLTLFAMFLCALYFFIGNVTAEIAAMCLVLHFATDFVAGKSMPFYPFSKTEVFLGIFPYGYRNKIIFEIASTIIAGVLFWLATAGTIL